MKFVAEQQELEKIRVAAGGMLKPETVVDVARDPNNPLHRHFTWDDTQAAAERRIDQARQIIRLCVVVVHENVAPVRRYISLPSDRANGGGYRSTQEVLTDESRRGELLRDVLERLNALRRKYAALSELSQLWAAVDAVAEKAEKSSATG